MGRTAGRARHGAERGGPCEIGRRISYGEVVKFATVPAEPPKLGEADLQLAVPADRRHAARRRAVEGRRLGEVRH